MLLPVIALVGIYAGLTSVHADEWICNEIENKSPHYQLKRHLFCDYDPNVRPTTGKNKTVVQVFIIPKLAEYSTWSNSLDLHVWLYTEWKDAFLTWTPSDFGDINETHVTSSEIWTPQINALDSGGGLTAIPESSCIVRHRGTVVCVPAVKFTLTCDADYTFWPYDRHTCALQLGAWSHRGDEVVVSTRNFHVIMFHYKSNPQWKISVADSREIQAKSKFSTNDLFPTISTSFSVKRPSPEVRNVVVSPVIILTAMTVTTLWLRPGSTERLIISCVNLLGHFIVLESVDAHLPHTGSNLPNILLFYNNSLILSAVALTLTCWLQRLTNWKRQVPVWLSTSVSAILASRPGQILLLTVLDPKVSAKLEEGADDNSDLVNPESNRSNWEYVVVLIGWISFFSFLVTYFIMFGVFFRYSAGDDDGREYL